MFFGWLVVIVGTAVFLFTNELIAKVLTGGEFNSLPKITIILFGAYYCIRVWSDMFAMLLQSINKMKVFWVYAPFMCFISVVGQYFFGKIWGINGILIGLMLAFLATSTWILPITLKKVVNKYYLK